jgi:hypothetical protein
MDGIDRASLTAAGVYSRQIAQDWQQSAAMSALVARFAGLGEADLGEITHRVHMLLDDDGWVGELIAPLVEALAAEPWLEPPLRVSRDGLKIGAVLFDSRWVTIAASITSADALALLPPPRSVVVPGRLTVVRYVRSGGAHLRLWRAEPIEGDFDAARARPASPLGTLPLGTGVVLRLDGRSRGWWIEGAVSDVVTLTATIRAGQDPVMREYALPTGNFLRCATLDDGAAQAQMLLTLLRLSKRADAAERFAAATRDPATFLRWSAMREWLALDARAALPRLGEMAVGDPNVEIRAAAQATLAMVEDRMAAAPCPA